MSLTENLGKFGDGEEKSPRNSCLVAFVFSVKLDWSMIACANEVMGNMAEDMSRVASMFGMPVTRMNHIISPYSVPGT